MQKDTKTVLSSFGAVALVLGVGATMYHTQNQREDNNEVIPLDTNEVIRDEIEVPEIVTSSTTPSLVKREESTPSRIKTDTEVIQNTVSKSTESVTSEATVPKLAPIVDSVATATKISSTTPVPTSTAKQKSRKTHAS